MPETPLPETWWERIKKMSLSRMLPQYRTPLPIKSTATDTNDHSSHILEAAREEIAKSKAANEEAERLLAYIAAVADIRLLEHD